MHLLTDNEALFILKNKDVLPNTENPLLVKAADAAADIITLLKGKAHPKNNSIILSNEQIDQANEILKKLGNSSDANIKNIAIEIVNKKLLLQQSKRKGDTELFHVADRKNLESIYKLGMTTVLQRTGQLEPQAGGSTANQLGEKEREWVEERIYRLVREFYLQFNENFIKDNPWIDKKVREYGKFKGTGEEKEIVRKLKDDDIEEYKSFLTKEKGSKRVSKLPTLSPKTKDAINTFIKTLPENHFLIRLGKVSVLREKRQEGAITAQYVYGGMKIKEELVIPNILN